MVVISMVFKYTKKNSKCVGSTFPYLPLEATKSIGLSILGKLRIGPAVVLRYFIFIFNYWDGFRQVF